MYRAAAATLGRDRRIFWWCADDAAVLPLLSATCVIRSDGPGW